MIIKPIKSSAKNESDEYFKNAKLFTKVPFVTLQYGSTATGKSTALANILLQDLDGLFSFYDPENIYIFAPNAPSDINLRAVTIQLDKRNEQWSKNNLFETLQPQMMLDQIAKNRLMFNKKPTERNKRLNHKLWLIDDQAMDKQMRSRYGVISNIAVQGRHQLISAFILVQNITAVEPTVRRNAPYIMAFNMNSETERDILYDDYSAKLGRSGIRQAYERALDEVTDKHGNSKGFLFIRTYITQLNQGRFWSSFEKPFTFTIEE